MASSKAVWLIKILLNPFTLNTSQIYGYQLNFGLTVFLLILHSHLDQVYQCHRVLNLD